MKKILITMLIGLGILLTPIQINTTREITEGEKALFKAESPRISLHIQLADNHSVSIISLGGGGMGICSGTVINNSLDGATIITAKHCVGLYEEMYIENVPVTSIQSSVSRDLALLKTSTIIPNKVASSIAKTNVKKNGEVFGVGYPDGTAYPIYGKVFLKGLHDHYATAKVISGCSGGGLFNKDDELAGVIWGMNGIGFSIYNPVSEIRQFLFEVGYEEK